LIYTINIQTNKATAIFWASLARTSKLIPIRTVWGSLSSRNRQNIRTRFNSTVVPRMVVYFYRIGVIITKAIHKIVNDLFILS